MKERRFGLGGDETICYRGVCKRMEMSPTALPHRTGVEDEAITAQTACISLRQSRGNTLPCLIGDMAISQSTEWTSPFRITLHQHGSCTFVSAGNAALLDVTAQVGKRDCCRLHLGSVQRTHACARATRAPQRRDISNTIARPGSSACSSAWRLKKMDASTGMARLNIQAEIVCVAAQVMLKRPLQLKTHD